MGGLGYALGLALPVLAAILGVVAYRRLKAVILRFEARIDGIGRAMAATAAEMAGAREEIAALRRDGASPPQPPAVAVRPEWTAIPQELAALGQRTAAVQADLARLFYTTRSANILANPAVLEHLAALREDQAAPPRLSYPFQAAMRTLAPHITRRPGTTVLCTVALGAAYRAQVMPALVSHRAYAARHGLSHASLSDPPSYRDRPHSWMKIPLIMRLFEQGFERVVFIDADALITNPDFDLATVFGPDPGLGRVTVAEDEAGINCGVMFLEDGPALRRILDLVWLFDADVTQGTWEQFALKSLMALSHDVTRHVAIAADPRLFNAFPAERNRFFPTMERSTWRPGDFLCHFSGIRAPHLEPLIQAYAAANASSPGVE